MELEEAKKLLKEMQENCKNKKIYKDKKAEAKAEAIEVVFKELDKRGYIIKNIIDVLVQEGFIKKGEPRIMSEEEKQELRNTKNNCPQFNISGIKCKNKDIHCPTSKETLDYYENFLISGYEEEIKKLKKENEELKNKVVKRDNELIDLEETAEKEFITKQEVKENYIPKSKIREKIKKLENEEKALRKDFEKHRVQLFELYKKVVLIEGYKKLLEEG